MLSEEKPNYPSTINTSGGSHVHGNVDAGKDFVGRDKINVGDIGSQIMINTLGVNN